MVTPCRCVAHKLDVLKDSSLKNENYNYYLLTLMPTEGQVYFVSLQNSAGVLKENSAEYPKCK